jgi:dTDP-4-amino-4,6-dideoxy-D-galactose acyltransferase
MSGTLEQALDSDPTRHAAYSRYSPIRSLAPLEGYQRIVRPDVLAAVERPGTEVVEITAGGENHWFVIERLAWDTEFFGIPIHRIHAVAFTHHSHVALADAAATFRDRFRHDAGDGYCFVEIPSEDTQLLQALTAVGFRLIETRLIFVWSDPGSQSHPRVGVRQATSDDVANLRAVAAEMRNPFDRFHADPALPPGSGDRFLARYIEESIKGFADFVLVPDVPGVPADSFNTSDIERDMWPIVGDNVSRMVLAAVRSSTNRGWYIHLISESLHRLRAEGATRVLATTQSTNGAVLHTWAKLGGEIGATRHILALA